jgi:hypothetical protein
VICEYYNLILSINHASYLRKGLECSGKNDNLMKELPSSISDRDLYGGKYNFTKTMEMRYPKDYLNMEMEFVYKSV